MFDYQGGIMTGDIEQKEPRLRCGNCKALDSMTKPYGKTKPCTLCGNPKCKGQRALRCEFCNYKYSEEY